MFLSFNETEQHVLASRAPSTVQGKKSFFFSHLPPRHAEQLSIPIQFFSVYS